MRKIALFVGSHADDIELGAGATVAKLSQEGWVVRALVLTRDADDSVASLRRQEAEQAARVLGILAGNIRFVDFPDGSLMCDGSSVEKVRQAVVKMGESPSIVFTHTSADSHRDHREARAIVVSAFRAKPILGFAVVNSLVRAFSQYEGFRPTVFVDATEFSELKFISLAEHKSQRSRIDVESVTNLLHEYGRRTSTLAAEAFDMLVQEGVAPDDLALVGGLNHSPFHQFWSSLIGERTLVMLRAEPVWRRLKDTYWRPDQDREGIALLYNAFRREWDGRVPLEDQSCHNPSVERYLDEYDILLSGGAITNAVTRGHFNYFSGVRYVIDFTMPDYRDVCIRDRLTNAAFRATYKSQRADLSSKVLIEDIGVLTIMQNPYNSSRVLLGCMGIHGYGTLACFHYLAQPELISELKSIIPSPIHRQGYQVLVRYNVSSQNVRLDTSTLVEFTSSG